MRNASLLFIKVPVPPTFVEDDSLVFTATSNLPRKRLFRDDQLARRFRWLPAHGTEWRSPKMGKCSRGVTTLQAR